MSNTSESEVNNPSEEWIEIRNIEKKKRDYNQLFVRHPMAKTNWEYTPSGSICANFCELHMYIANQLEYIDSGMKVFTFVDLVKKISFEITIAIRAQAVHNFYFLAEDQLVFVWVDDQIVYQTLYKVDYVSQTLRVENKTKHNFKMPNEQFEKFEIQPVKCVRFNQIDYMLLVGNADLWEVARFEKRGCMIYLVPKDPLNKHLPTKKFVFEFPEEDFVRFKQNVGIQMRRNGHNLRFYMFEPNIRTCMVRGTKLWFSQACMNQHHRIIRYELTGSFWEVDLMKLKDISTRQINRTEDLQQIFNEKEGAVRLVERGDIHMLKDMQELEFYHSQADIGTVYLSRKLNQMTKSFENTLFVHPEEKNGFSEQTVLKYKISSPSQNASCRLSYSLHPQGALLQFMIVEGGLIRLRVAKCLRMNLQSLAFNRALFHQSTQLSNHPAYGLCFNGAKPLEYGNIDEKKSSEPEFATDFMERSCYAMYGQQMLG